MNTDTLLQLAKTTTKPKQNLHVNKGTTKPLTEHRKVIAKLRQRQFTWRQIEIFLNSNGINVNYNNLYQWQLRTYKHKRK